MFVCEIVTPVKTLSRLYKKAQEFSIGFDQCEADILNLSINISDDKVNKQNFDRFCKYVPNISDYSFDSIHNNLFYGSKKYRGNLFSIKYKKIPNHNGVFIRKNLFKYRLYKDVMDPIKFFYLLPILQDCPPIDQLNKEFIDSVLVSTLDSFSTNLPHLLGKTYKEIESEFFQIKNKFGLDAVKYLWANTKPEKNLNKLSEIEYYLLHKR
jgi:hypothetical protein